MKKIIGFLSCLVFFSSYAVANPSISTTKTQVQAIGKGVDKDREIAIKKAVRQATESVVGFRLKSDQEYLKKSLKGNHEDSSGNKEAFYTDKKGLVDNIATNVTADVKNYQIIKEEKIDDKWHVEVVVEAVKIDREYDIAKLNNKRRTIAVLGGGSSYDASFLDIGPSGVAEDMQQQIISALTSTRKFRVLDRDTPSVYEAEKALIQGEDANPDEAARLGKVLGADYFVLFDIKDIGIVSKDNKKSITVKSKKPKFYAMVDYRVFAMATREIKFSDSINVEFTPKTNVNNKLGVYNEVLKDLALEMASRIIEDIYPPRVYAVTGKEIAIAQNLKVGDKYECYELGDMIKDVYTGEEVDFIETPVGMVEVSRATAKVSYARILKGDVRRGDLCRKMQNLDGSYKRTSSESGSSNVIINENGGVVLPF